MRRKIKKMDCIEYLSVQAPLEKVNMLEDKQSKYIHEFVKRKEYSIVGKIRRNGFSQRDVDRQWNQIVNMIRKKQISGVVVANMAAISSSVGMNEDTRRNVDRIYNFKTGCVKPECLHEGWQTSGSAKVVRMAFNLYCNGTPSVDDEQDTEEQVDECRRYSVEDLFCCCYAPYFWQAIQIRYPEYATYNKNLYAMFGGND